MHEILYLVSRRNLDDVHNEILRLGGAEPPGRRPGSWVLVQVGPRGDTTGNHARTRHRVAEEFQIRLVSTEKEAHEQLSHHYFRLVIIDHRSGAGDSITHFTGSVADQFLKNLHYQPDPELMYPLSRIIVLLDDDDQLAENTFCLGRYQIGGYITHPYKDNRLLKKARRIIGLASGVEGKRAICIGGGGVEGLLFEVGVLRALDAHMENFSVNEFDVYCGISAGAVVAALIGQGVHPVDLALSFEGKSAVLEPIGSGLVYDVAVKEILKRIGKLLISSISHWPFYGEILSDLIKAFPDGIFAGDRLLDYLQRHFQRPGFTDDFGQLKNELYIGATNQDTSEHVIFGEDGWRDVPISSAIRASCSIAPFFKPTEIKGTHFVDGQFTRTANFRQAAKVGSKLMIIIDPIVPILTSQPGYVRSKGGIFELIQGLKALIHNRFMYSLQNVKELYPDVDFIVFRPEAEDMRVMSGSPMKYAFRTEIIRLAYNCTVRKLYGHGDIIKKMFLKRGIRLRTDPLDAEGIVPRPRAA